MANRRGTATTQRQPARADQGQTHSFLPTEVVEALVAGGWQRAGISDPQSEPSTADTWVHETKSGGHPLPSQQAYESEQRARAAEAEANETPEDRDARLATEREATEREAFIANRTAEEGRRAAAEEQARLDRIAQIEHEEAIAEDVPVHDQLGQVMLWRCYACKFGCRYSPACTCETCAKITEAIGCPNCGDEQPNVDPRRR